MTNPSYVEAGILSKTQSTGVIDAPASGLRRNAVGEALAHEVANELFERPVIGQRSARKEGAGALQILLIGEVLIGISGDVLDRDAAQRELPLDLSPPPPPARSLLDEVAGCRR